MTATNGWLGKPGVPLNPERDGDDLVKRLQADGDVLRHIETQAAEIARLGAACDAYFRQVSLTQIKHARHLPALERRIARQRRALAKLYERRHDKNAALATARREGMEEAAKRLIEKYQSMVIRPNTGEAWRICILQDLREMAGEKINVITAADIDAAAIRAAAKEEK